jgi:hypothetical protein
MSLFTIFSCIPGDVIEARPVLQQWHEKEKA